MHRFTDAAGRDWLLTVNVNTVKRVREALGLNLLEVLGGDVLERLAADPILLVDTLYVICQPQAKERGLSDEQFGEAMAGESIGQAAAALVEALLDFFQPAQRQLLGKLWAKIQQAEGRATAAALTNLERPEIDEAIERVIQQGQQDMLSRLKSLGKSSTDAPA